jgi:uridine kinase
MDCASSPGGPPDPPLIALEELADRLRALPPSLGPVRLVAVDGHAGAGKSTLADRLAAALGGAPVLRLDDIASHDRLFDWTRRLTGQVLEPLSRGERARYRVYDWQRRAFTRTAVLDPAPVVLLEGVGAGRRAVRPCLAALIWLEVAREVAWTRGELRDGTAQREFWDGWKRAESGHFADDPSRPFADILLAPQDTGYAARQRERPDADDRTRGYPLWGTS